MVYKNNNLDLKHHIHLFKILKWTYYHILTTNKTVNIKKELVTALQMAISRIRHCRINRAGDAIFSPRSPRREMALPLCVLRPRIRPHTPHLTTKLYVFI